MFYPEAELISKALCEIAAGIKTAKQDQLSRDERIRLECLMQATKLSDKLDLKSNVYDSVTALGNVIVVLAKLYEEYVRGEIK